MPSRLAVAVAILVGLLRLCAAADAPLLYLPFDGQIRAVASGGGSAAVGAESELAFCPGVRGQAVVLRADCRFPAAGNFEVRAGTVAFWLRPHWPGSDSTGRYLFSLYGDPRLPEPWLRNRWSVATSAGTIQFWIFGSDQQKVQVAAEIRDWQPEQWHQVAVSWANVNSGQPDAELCLYLDGSLAQTSVPRRLDVGPVGETLDVGRDSDNSPDYAEADYDELYIYARALTASEVRKAFALTKDATPEPTQAAPKGEWRPDWGHDSRRCRCRVEVRGAKPGAGQLARLPLDLQTDLNALGLAGVPGPASLWLVPCPAGATSCPQDALPVPTVNDGQALSWPVDALSATGGSAFLYFAVAELDLTTPLFARHPRYAWPAPAETSQATPLPDYATTAYGDSWDFDEGDFEEIDQWGNKPEFIRNRKVADGVLSFDVSADPWFIWGDMWGQVPRSSRPVAIDLQRYPVLLVRLRQSCPTADWDLFGRVGQATELLHHVFRVTGTGWQVVRVDLRREAHWRGVLSAFRIDPTSEVADAHIEIDWVRLVNQVEAQRAPVEVLGGAGPALSRLHLRVEATECRVGSAQVVVAQALGAGDQPVAGQPLVIRLVSQSDGHLEAAPGQSSLALGPRARRGLTDIQGRLAMVLVCGHAAGVASERLEAVAEFATAVPAAVSLHTTVGPPHHYAVAPRQPLLVAAGRLPVEVTAQLVDEFDNPLPVAGRKVKLVVEEGAALSPVEAVTDAGGRVRSALRLDPARRWVVRVGVQDDGGLSGISAAVSIVAEGPRANPVRALANGYFADAAGRPFVPLGGFYANWVQKETPDGEWGKLVSFTDTSDEEKRQWLRFLAGNGVTVVRFMLRTHRPGGMEPMDIGGRVNPPLLAEALRYLDLGREVGLRFQLVIHEDYDKPVYCNESHLRRFALPQYTSVDLAALPLAPGRFLRELNLLGPSTEKYTDADAIACQDLYARELVGVLAGNPQVFAYELENEMVNCPAAWANHAIATVRAVDGLTPVGVSHGGGGLHTADPLWWHRNVRLDFYNYHLYPHGGPTTPQTDYGAAVDVLARYGRMAGVCLLGEAAGDQFGQHPSRETRRYVMRDIIWLALTSGNPGVLFWNARGSEVAEFRLAADAMAQLDLATFRRATPEIGIDVRHPLDDDRFYRTEAGVQAYAMMGRYAQHYLSQGTDTDFTFDPDGYDQSCGLGEFSPPAPKRRPFRVSPGWQLKSLVREDWRQALIYIRNFAGIEGWDSPMGKQAWRQYLRKRSAAPLLVRLDLPVAACALRVYDLDEPSVRNQDATGTAELDLGTSNHDFAVVVQCR